MQSCSPLPVAIGNVSRSGLQQLLRSVLVHFADEKEKPTDENEVFQHVCREGSLHPRNRKAPDLKVKDEYNVPGDVEACHTMDVGDYYIEGHVPLAAINTLAEETPNIVGISLPGMPRGSPGMSGEKTGEFVVYAVREDGSSDEFMRI